MSIQYLCLAVAWSGFPLSPTHPHSSPESHQDPQPLVHLSPHEASNLPLCCLLGSRLLHSFLTTRSLPPLSDSHLESSLPHIQCGQLTPKLCQPHLKASPSPLLPRLQPWHWTPHPAGLGWASQGSPGSLPRSRAAKDAHGCTQAAGGPGPVPGAPLGR